MKRITVFVIIWFCFAVSVPLQARWKGEKHVYAEAGVLKELDYFESYLAMLNAGVEYDGNGLRTFGIELNVWQYIEQNYASTGIGLRPATKYYLWRTNFYKVFLEVKGGVIYMTPQFPDGGSRFNFTLTGALAGDFRLTEKLNLRVAARYNHMSNWGLFGDGNNPSWDGMGVAIGGTWQFH